MDNFLGSGEYIIWEGKSKPLAGVNKLDIILRLIVGSGFLFLAFKGLQMFQVFNGFTEGVLLVDFGIVLFILIGLGGGIFIISSIIKDYLDLKNTRNILTNKRIIIVLDRRTKSVSSIDLKDIVKIDYKENTNGTGSIIFEDDIYEERRHNGNRTRVLVYKAKGFYGIEDVERVYKLILEEKNK